jgi:hypothetical protein
MANLYFDENMSLLLEALLRERGHMVFSTFSEGRLGSPDPHQLLFAAERDWILITHNRRDYRLLHDAWHLWSHAWDVNRRHSGILILDQVPGQPVEEMPELIHGLVHEVGASLSNRLHDWRPATGWRRSPA